MQATNTDTTVQKVTRVRAIHDLATLFPECPGLEHSAARRMPGFKDAGPMVPDRKIGFLQESEFMEEFTSFVSDNSEFMISLTGPTGCGKTERVLDFYSRLNVPVYHVSAHSDMKPYHLTGSKELVNGETKFQPGPLYRAMVFGYPFLMDEAFRLSSKITSKFHMIRDRGEFVIDETNETIKAKKGFKFILTANQAGYGDMTGMYPGDSEQDIAYLNGISCIECDYPSKEIEQAIVQGVLESAHPAFANEPALADFAPKMVSFANKVRSLFIGNEDNQSTDSRVEIPISTRTLIKWARKFVDFRGSSNPVHPLYRGLDYVCMRRACTATRITVDALLLAEFGISRVDAH